MGINNFSLYLQCTLLNWEQELEHLDATVQGFVVSKGK